jgi:type I restriction enzyme S subunit
MTSIALGKLCQVDWGNTNLTKSAYVDTGKYLAVSATGGDGRIEFAEHKENVAVLSAIGAQCGKMFFPGVEFTAIKNTITLTPIENTAIGKYLYYLFTHIQLPIRGAGQPFISKGDIEKFEIPVMHSLPEQKAIVEKLDAAFAEIDQLEANLETKSRYTNELLNSILGSAFSGDGVSPDQHQGVDMKMVRLEDLCSISTGSTDTKDAVADGTYPLFDRSKTIKRSTKYLFDCEALIIPGEGAEFLPKYYSGKFDLHQRAYALFDMKSELDIQFLKYYLIFVKDYFPRVAVGATVKSLRRRHFADLEIPLPSLTEQKVRVEKLDIAFTAIDELRKQTRVAKESFLALRQSILSSVFTEKSDAA